MFSEGSFISRPALSPEKSVHSPLLRNPDSYSPNKEPGNIPCAKASAFIFPDEIAIHIWCFPRAIVSIGYDQETIEFMKLYKQLSGSYFI